MAYIFHGNEDSFDMMIFTTIIQPKIHKHHLYFNLFFTSKYFLSRHDSKAWFPPGDKSGFYRQISDKSKVIAEMAITLFWCEC